MSSAPIARSADELAAYGHGLADKPEIVGLNKIDALDPDDGAAQSAAQLPQRRRPRRRRCCRCPASAGAGVPEVLARAAVGRVGETRSEAEAAVRRARVVHSA